MSESKYLVITSIKISKSGENLKIKYVHLGTFVLLQVNKNFTTRISAVDCIKCYPL
uniref:Uncharacterized protein n=1 Tax=Rhizophora mucronata TaxID=61149 RepID=A0A2P2LTH5_RHIMU